MQTFSEKVEQILEFGGLPKDILFLIFSGIALLISIFDWFPLPFDTAWVAILLCGLPILLEAVTGLITRFDIKADVLVSLALLASICIGETFAAGEVAFIMQIGALLEDITVSKAQAGIEKLVHLTPQKARLLSQGTETIIPAEQVHAGDILRVLPGETIPVDGIILTGQTAINQAVLTGESLPVDKTVNDTVSSGTVNQFGAFTMKATRVGEDSSIQRMIRLVQSADAGKAKIVRLADRWATWIVVLALTAALLTWLISGAVIRAVTILVVFCPCALVLATPTAIMAAIGNATRHGFLVREGDALERLSATNRVTFDKTGTLTCGTPQVTAIKSVSAWSEKQLYSFLAAAEQLSEHPLGKAIVRCYRQSSGQEPLPCTQFVMLPGKGVTATVAQKAIVAGNRKLFAEQQLAIPKTVLQETDFYRSQGSTVIYLAIDDRLSGYAILSDTVRRESTAVISRLQQLGITPVLLTGDTQNAAATIGQLLHIQDMHASCLPEDKLTVIDQYQQKGEHICMIGDGINDAPALKCADVGIAMGGIGSDIAVDAADIVLVDDEIKELPHLFALSRRMMFTIKCNLTFSMSLNLLAVLLAMAGILNPVVGALVHNAGSVLVILNSALLLPWKSR